MSIKRLNSKKLSFYKIAALWCLLAGLCPLSAQQEGNQITQYMFNTYAYNAGFAGMSNGINASLLHRQQWTGWGKGSEEKHIAPNSTVLLVDMPINAIKGGAGVELASYNVGYFRDIYVKLGYTYHLQTGFGLIGLGVRAQIESVGLDNSKLKPDNASDIVILSGKESENALYGDVGIGFYLIGNEHYSVGIGLNNLISHRSSKISYRPSRTLAIHGSYTVSFPSLPKVEFTPSTYLETDFHQVNWMINLTGTFNKRFWAGLGYRLRDAVCINAGINIGKLQIGAAYDITASRMIRASKIGGSFEVMVRYCFGLESEKVNTDYKNARYL